jgi:hypothetical protein
MGMRRMSEQDRYDNRATVPLSDLQMTAVEGARARRGMPRGAWLREAVEEKLEREGIEIVDEARRPAPRRQNYSERQAGQAAKGQTS